MSTNKIIARTGQASSHCSFHDCGHLLFLFVVVCSLLWLYSLTKDKILHQLS